MLTSFSSVLAALCLATLNNLSDVAQKDAGLNKVNLAQSLSEMQTIHLFSAVAESRANKNQADHCIYLAEKKLIKIHHSLCSLEYFCIISILSLLHQNGDINRCRQSMLAMTKKIQKELAIDFALLFLPSSVPEFAKIQEDLKILKIIFNNIETNINDYMQYIFTTHIKSTLTFELLILNFVHQHNTTLSKPAANQKEFLETQHQLSLATLKLWAFKNPKQMFTCTTEEQQIFIRFHRTKLVTEQT